MYVMRLFRSFRTTAFRKKDTMLAGLALLIGLSAMVDSIPDWEGMAASCLLAVLLMSAVHWSRQRVLAYTLCSLALLVYMTTARPDHLFVALIIAYVLLLLFAFLLPNPLYTLAAALAIGTTLYLSDEFSHDSEWITHLFFISLNAAAYTILAYYTRSLERERNEYRHLSMIDSLTGLASLQQTLLFGQRLIDEGHPVRVLLIDLNFFKQINDTYGHMVGNKVILLVADYLRQLIKPFNGIAGRLGGDEFVVVVEDTVRLGNIRQRLLDELSGQTFIPHEGAAPVSLSFSVGVSATRPERDARIEDLLHDADLNMYEFKLHHRLPTFHGKTADLIEHNPDPICTFDRRGKLIAVNPAAAKLLGHPADAMTRGQFIGMIHPQDRSRAFASFSETLKGAPVQLDLRMLHRDSHTVLVHVTNIPIIADHQIVGMYAIAKDMTEQKKAEELLRNSDRLAVTGQLAAGLAHEIRNPLTALKGFIQLLQSQQQANKAYYPIMLTELERINFIVNEFLLLSRPRPANFREADLRIVIEHVVTLLETQAILNKVHLVFEQPLPIPPIRCDENQMKQVFINILKNAIEAMPHGGEVTIRAAKAGDRLLVRIADQGGGIPDELIQQVGQPFFTTKETGTGLGLMICHNIMENHEGKLKIRSVPNEGTTVELELPFSPSAGSGTY
ncbi:diguanylate cyclase domain-containing protein [Paenibacillus hodogayensis]|uniref:histidine kinase n=1 Tax=Paenibacillus hodogayensis TaxID=279208 RepID=A0ABV5W527_9BACL